MFTLTSEALVNPDPDDLQLTVEQVFAGLKRRACATNETDPALIPPGHIFTAEQRDDGVIKRCTLDDETLREWSRFGATKTSMSRHTFHGGRVVVVHYAEGWPQGVKTEMIATTADGELTLRLAEVNGSPALEQNSPAEKEMAARFGKHWETLATTVVAQIREMARGGEL